MMGDLLPRQPCSHMLTCHSPVLTRHARPPAGGAHHAGTPVGPPVSHVLHAWVMVLESTASAR